MTHQPVLLKEAVSLLDIQKGEMIIDGTAGSGGHAEAILKVIGQSGKLLMADWDKMAIAKLKEKFKHFSNVILANDNYRNLPKILENNNLPKANGLLLDLGFSSEQIESRGRGFSFQSSAAGEQLLMTYSDELESLGHWLKRVAFEELRRVISEFGEERYANKIAKAIFDNKSAINTAGDLAEIIKKAVPKSYERGRIHPATRTFQAFRIFLNQELENLRSLLNALSEILQPAGRIVIISFHSLEDRIVKRTFQELSKKGRLKILTKKPIRPSEEEIKINPRARSAKLRAAIMN